MSETFFLIDGETGSGKSVWMADKVIEVARRNRRWHDRALEKWQKEGVVYSIKEKGYIPSTQPPAIREIWTCMKFSDEFAGFHGGWGGRKQGDGFMLHHWDSEEFHRVIPYLRNCDVFIDEIAATCPNDGWKDTPLETRRFFAQHRKRGIEIYANTQDFAMVDINARRMMSRVYHAIKVIGSRDISATKPPPRFVWGLIAVMEIKNFRTATSAADRQYDGFPVFIFIDKDLVAVYDTTEDIKGAGFAPLRHISRKCELHGLDGHDCTFEKTMHV